MPCLSDERRFHSPYEGRSLLATLQVTLRFQVTYAVGCALHGTPEGDACKLCGAVDGSCEAARLLLPLAPDAGPPVSGRLAMATDPYAYKRDKKYSPPTGCS